MATYNIEMNTLNSSGSYDQLFPQTYLNNIVDWNSNLYTKSEVDSLLSTINNSLSTKGSIEVVKANGTGTRTLSVNFSFNIDIFFMSFYEYGAKFCYLGMGMKAATGYSYMWYLRSYNNASGLSGSALTYTASMSAGSLSNVTLTWVQSDTTWKTGVQYVFIGLKSHD